jgi:ATP-binding protein involved in chromosome partitioning
MTAGILPVCSTLMTNRQDQPPSASRPLRDPLATTPSEIRQAGERQLAIAWADGGKSLFDVRELRLACGCATCVDEWTGEDRLDPASVPEDVHPVTIDPVGRYAIQITWSDGHDTGIYPFDRLRNLSAALATPGEAH